MVETIRLTFNDPPTWDGDDDYIATVRGQPGYAKRKAKAEQEEIEQALATLRPMIEDRIKRGYRFNGAGPCISAASRGMGNH